jgi:hypothetical protein
MDYWEALAYQDCCEKISLHGIAKNDADYMICLVWLVCRKITSISGDLTPQAVYTTCKVPKS